ncbi:MAG TPA: PilZ domain-containing protein [Bacteriovoracaceae bacterium]|nr:PilZ domain-containing protein [Bacteriovoracaceae bacterium]
MKIITAETDFLAYQKILKHLKANQCPLIIWQPQPEGRSVLQSYLNSFHQDTKLMHLDKTENVKLYSEIPVYCYSEKIQMIFKTQIFDLADRYFSLHMPQELKIIEEAEATKVQVRGIDFSTIWRSKRLGIEQLDEKPNYYKVKSMSQRSNRDQELLNTEFGGISLDEEDRLFADKRESPRARPQTDKKVKLKIKDHDQTFVLKLFDLSRGGMGFICEVENQFSKGHNLLVLGFDNFELDDPLFGQVMSVRPIDGESLWKVGVKFEDGQD